LAPDRLVIGGVSNGGAHARRGVAAVAAADQGLGSALDGGQRGLIRAEPLSHRLAEFLALPVPQGGRR
jgi:hypothetical protein